MYRIRANQRFMAIIPNQTEKNIFIDTPQKQKDRKLAAIFIGVAFLAAGIIYFGFFSGQSASPDAGNVPAAINGLENVLTAKENQSNAVLESLGQTTLANSIFSNKQLESLIFSDKLPMAVGVKGRDNPFAPF